jgi:hypothetical protein
MWLSAITPILTSLGFKGLLMAASSGTIAALSRAACSGEILAAVGVDRLDEGDDDPPVDDEGDDPDWPLVVPTEQPAMVTARNVANVVRRVQLIMMRLLEKFAPPLRTQKRGQLFMTTDPYDARRCRV